MPTHGQKVTGTGGTAARAITQIGNNITLPAGGPWHIHHVWGQVVSQITTADQGTGGELIVNAASGDLSPDPAPGIYPLIGSPVAQGANAPNTAVPLNLWEVNWQAPGKAAISLSYRNLLAITTGSIVAAGILFSDTPPAVKPLTFVDSVQASFASATEQSIGSITLAEKATRIVGILADLNKGDTALDAEAILATIRLSSDSVLLTPAEFPCNRAFNASDGVPVGRSAVAQSQFIPLDIEVIGGSIIDVFATSTEAVTNNVDLSVYLAYE